MATLRQLRGESLFSVPCFGQTLTLYRQGAWLALTVGLSTFVGFNLPWHLLGVLGHVVQLLLTAVGCYFAATLTASRAPVDLNVDVAATRWL